MSLIKYIHCFGTSYTAGGGYEWDSKEKRDKLKQFYNKSSEKPTQFNYSWPGQLQKMIKSKNIKVFNHAKSGFGNERMYRLVTDIIMSDDFNKEEHLFLLEFSGVGRKEIYSNTFKDYLIFNYDVRDFYNTNNWDCALDYFRHNDSELNKLMNIRNISIDFFKETLNFDEKVKEVNRKNLHFVSFLLTNKINYLFTVPPLYAHKKYFDKIHIDYNNETNLSEKWISFGDSDSNDFVRFYHDLDLTITKETNGFIQDGHASLEGNKKIAYHIYNKLIKSNLITE